MNCKPADLAIVVKSVAGNEGRIVRCIRVLSPTEADKQNYWAGPLWEIDVQLRAISSKRERFTNHCPDENLRPIRPQSDDATDEMLLIAGLPERKVLEPQS